MLVHEMPHTHELLTRSEIDAWRATLVVRPTAVLSLEHRQQVDAELATKLGVSSAGSSTPGSADA